MRERWGVGRAASDGVVLQPQGLHVGGFKKVAAIEHDRLA
jgi:hypothetical protein